MITVYSKPACVQCTATMRALYAKGVAYSLIDLTEDAGAFARVWGPYHSAMLPGMWLNEGGQSAAGAAIDHLLTMHPAFEEADALAKAEGLALPVWLANRAKQPDLSDAVCLATGLTVIP